MADERVCLIGLTLLKGVGYVLARHLLQYFGTAAKVFDANPELLKKVPGIGVNTAVQINESRQEALRLAEKELSFVEKNKIRLYGFNDADYPRRLKECNDAPVVFYFKGETDLNAPKILSIVGTRRVTNYGLKLTETLVADLAAMFPELLIISGLAYGVDISAHRAAMKNGLPTVGVLAHGLNLIYPYEHRKNAVEMLKHGGGLLTDFISNTNPDRENFLSRNRLIAGLSDATIVVESAERGGSLVTADIAFSYGRDVYTFPGRATDEFSAGCNSLIRMNKAGLITSARDLVMSLCWDVNVEILNKQPSMQFTQRPDNPIIHILEEKGEFHINRFAAEMKIPVHKMMSMLFELELKGHIQALPGGMYKLS